ncbi:MAG: Ldh family oxidoreductase [Cyclobacteriaceae bacterium]|nr:Ldh family oxidoreductase [Cyclobacteriaceae bacterium HetDA_MAG_MS6]
MVFSYDKLFEFTKSILTAIGCPDAGAQEAASVLLSADLRGIDSHGVARLIGYVRLYEKGRINPNPKLSITYETPSTAVMDGDAALGLISGPEAMRLALKKAQEVGSGWVAVKNSNHFGIAGYHTMMALDQDCIGIAMTNASPLVAPTFSKERLLGTNPISVAIPSGDEPPFVLDMATTTAANGKLEILQRKNLSAPIGWVQDQDGNPITNANGVKEGGALLPLGGDREHGSHKGYGLGAVVDILSAVLSGANYGPWAPPFVAFLDPVDDPVGQGLGHFFGAMRIDGFRPAEEFKTHMDNWLRRFRNADTVTGQDQVLVPGDPEREMERDRRENGIPLLEPVARDLQSLADKYEIAFS